MSSFNPLGAIWKIYLFSKWSSQLSHHWYIRHGWMTSCGRGRHSATREFFGRGSRGTIFGRSSKLSLFLPEMSVSERFCFRRFWKIWRHTLKLWSFWFRRCLGGFRNLRSVTGHFLRPRSTITSSFRKFPFFFPKKSRCYLTNSYGHPQAEQGTLVTVSQKLERKLDFRALAISRAEGQMDCRRDWYKSCAMIHVPKGKKNKEISVWLKEVSTLHHPQTSEFWRTSFQDTMLLPFCTSPLSCTWM